MPDHPTEPSGPFDVKNLHQLVRLMKRYDLTAIDLVEGEVKIRLRRRGPEPALAASAHTSAPPPPPVTHAAPAAPAAPAPAPASSADLVIESPMVGTFYLSPAPDAPPYVSVGSVVSPGTTVGVFEAMKVFTEIPAGVAGTVTEILVKNGQAVDFGQPLFRVRPA
jgi:acetyl-CoA carboxylase biotin carboxyl carrier protein